jgi:hypothetical protein
MYSYGYLSMQIHKQVNAKEMNAGWFRRIFGIVRFIKGFSQIVAPSPSIDGIGIGWADARHVTNGAACIGIGRKDTPIGGRSRWNWHKHAPSVHERRHNVPIFRWCAEELKL